MSFINVSQPNVEAQTEKALVFPSSDGRDSDSCTPEDTDIDVYTTWYGQLFAPLRELEAILDRKLGVESQGPSRVLPNERLNPPHWTMFSLWASSNLNLTTFSLGLVGSQLGLDFARTITILVCGALAGATLTAWCAIAGPQTGLRQVSISRYSLGWYPSKVIAILNFVEQIGWGAVSTMTGGLALTAVSNGTVSLVVGVIVIAIAGTSVSFAGLRAVLGYEKFAWVPVFVVFLVMYVEAGKHADNSSPPRATGVELSASALSFFAIVYGATSSWSSVVSDFYVQYSIDTPQWKIFAYTLGGLTLPTCFAASLGACFGSTMIIDQAWQDAFQVGLGYLIEEALYPRGFAKFLLVVLVLASVGNTTICVYTASLAAQQFSRPSLVVPRTIWTLVVLAGILLLALLGRDRLLEILRNFLSLLGYWNTSFVVIIFTEHYLYRKGDYQKYDLRIWNDKRKLPYGFAGVFAFGAGVVGWILGMSETLYIGKLAVLIGSEGGDIGNELSLLFTVISFAPARWLEYSFVGK